MTILKPISEFKSSLMQPNAGRRSFIWKAGAAFSALFATTIMGTSKSRADETGTLNEQVNQLSNQLGIHEDTNAIRSLHQTYESHLDRGMYEKVVNLFADDGEVVFNGGIYTGKEKGIRRLYCDQFRSGFTGRKIEPAPGFQPDPAQHQDIVEVTLDRKSATGQFPYSIQVGTPMASNSSLVEMARLQGEGIKKWWEGGIHEVSYVKEGDSWKIKRLEYRVIVKANYAPGRSYAKPIDVPAFAETYPADPTGPDKLV